MNIKIERVDREYIECECGHNIHAHKIATESIRNKQLESPQIVYCSVCGQEYTLEWEKLSNLDYVQGN